jgi:hypothetical protein
LTDSQKSYLAGFFGRDRSDPSGIPNDNPIRTTVGAYPAAGLFDVSASQTGGNKFGTGDGIFPIITSWMVKFWMLEAQIALDVNTGYIEADLMAEAIGDQIDKVISVGTAADPQATSDIASWPTQYNWPIVFNTKTDYIDNISGDYPADGSDNLNSETALKDTTRSEEQDTLLIFKLLFSLFVSMHCHFPMLKMRLI